MTFEEDINKILMQVEKKSFGHTSRYTTESRRRHLKTAVDGANAGSKVVLNYFKTLFKKKKYSFSG